MKAIQIYIPSIYVLIQPILVAFSIFGAWAVTEPQYAIYIPSIYVLIQPILVAFSIFGAWAVTEPQYAQYGFMAWAISNVGWILVFNHQKDYWPCLLFFIYWILAVKGVLGV